MPDIPCRFYEPLDLAKVALSCECPNHKGSGAHTCLTLPLEEARAMRLGNDDPRWPKQCLSCDHLFSKQERSLSISPLYRCETTGEVHSTADMPNGSLLFASWLEDCEGYWRGPDGRILQVKTPGGWWVIDSRCSNCTLPNDDAHRCWVRHGDPRKPETLTVSKNGLTCRAGAGSIELGSYHGYLRRGVLQDA